MLKRAAAVAIAQGCTAGLGLLNELEASGQLRDYFLLPVSGANPLRRPGDWTAAPQARCRPLQLAGGAGGPPVFSRRLREMENKPKSVPADERP